MASLRLKLLGGFEASSAAGQSIEISGKKSQALLAYLAAHAGKKPTRDKLIGLLWSDRGEPQARSSLRQALLTLRRDLANLDPPPLIFDGDTVAMDASATSSDIAAFERLAASGAADDLRRAAEIYQGDLLDGVVVRDQAFEEWLVRERGRLRDMAIGVLGRLVGHLQGEEAVSTANRLIALDPLREASHRILMQLHAAQGRPEQALRQYAACRDILRRELGIEPSRETTALHREISEGKLPSSLGSQSSVAEAHGPRHPSTEATPTAASQPSIAVLPFTNMSDDAGQAYFSDGITEDIITELTRFRSLLVIARHSSFQYRGKDIDVRQVGRELGVDFIIEGSIRRSGERLRVTAQLVDARTGNHVWAERYDRDMRDIFALQEEMAQSIASTAGGRVEASRRLRAVRADDASLAAYDLVLRAKAVNWMYSLEANRQARAWTAEAIKIDPTNALAHAYYAFGRFMEYVGHWTSDPQAALRDAHQFARRAVELDESDIDARGVLGHALLAMREFDEAGIHFARAVELNPNNTEGRCWFGFYLFCIGKHDAAVEQFEIAKRRNPFDLAWMPWLKGGAYFSARRYLEAIASFNQIVEPIFEIRGWLAASYALAGQPVEARKMLDQFLREAAREMTALPKPRLKDWEPYWRRVVWYRDESDYEHLFEGLRKAGLPE